MNAGLEIIPVINKIDLPSAEPERVAGEVSELIGEAPESILQISGKTGAGVAEVLEELVERVPPPAGNAEGPARALIFDSEFDQYRGVVAYIRVVDGVFRKGEPIRAMAAGTEAEIDEVGFFSPQMMPTDQLAAGEVGYLITGLKDVTQLRVGDTLTRRAKVGLPGGEATEPLPGYREVKPMVFCGLFPIESDDYPDLRDALEKLVLNDAALSWEPETSDALGFGFRCGFLGLLHMDIVRERLEREYDLELLATMPSVEFDVTLVALVAGGHVLIEDYPGVGKTALARALAASIDADCARVQCTADMLPSDVVGAKIYVQRDAPFEFRPGPVFANIVLVDEINRASPKTQSGLLECMQERRVTVDGVTHELARPFVVIATQNPIEFDGTYPLPQAQLDRFMVRLSLGYPSSDESAMLADHASGDRVLELGPVSTVAEVVAPRPLAAIHASEALRGYVVALRRRDPPRPAHELGASPRAALMLLQAATRRGAGGPRARASRRRAGARPRRARPSPAALPRAPGVGPP